MGVLRLTHGRMEKVVIAPSFLEVAHVSRRIEQKERTWRHPLKQFRRSYRKPSPLGSAIFGSGLTRVEVEIKRLGDKIDNGLARLDAKLDNLDNKIDSVRGEIKSEIHHLDDKLTTALEIRERLAALETRMASR